VENGEERDLQYWGDRMTWLENQGFDVVEREFCYARELPDIIEKWSEKVRSGAMQTPVDGLVAVYDDTIYASGFTVTGHHDNGAGMAFKWPDKMKTAVLDHIEWSCGATCITPVAIFSPVELEGTRVTRASMHNISEAKRIGIGANGVTELSVYKANMIVPQVASADAKGSEPFEIPDRCPVCGSPTEIRISETKTRSGVKTVETLHCMNPDCIAKHLKKFARFVSKDGMNVEGLSQKKIADLISGGFIASYLDLMRLPYLPYTHGAVMDSCGNKLEDRDGWGKTSVENLLSAVQKSKIVDMEHLLYSLSIPMCGHHVSKLLLRTWHSKDLVDKINNDLSGLHASMQHIEGVGEKKADAFRAWFENRANLQLFNDLLAEVTLKVEEKKEKVSATCFGLTFVITGSVHSFKNRSEFAKYVEAHGGKVAGGVSKNTSYLVSNESSTSSKSVKAAKLGVPVITEDEFIARF
jgi:DNA ligase (NAD+)